MEIIMSRIKKKQESNQTWFIILTKRFAKSKTEFDSFHELSREMNVSEIYFPMQFFYQSVFVKPSPKYYKIYMRISNVTNKCINFPT